MKKIISFLTLAALTIGLLGSCVRDINARLDETEGDVAKLEAAIGQYSQLKADLTSVIQTLMAEVGDKPASDQGTVWSCINSLNEQCGTFDSAINTLKALVGNKSVSEQINDLVSQYKIDDLKVSVKAIQDALGDPVALMSRINQMSAKVEKIDDILSRITAIEGMIQSISIIPAFDDGSVLADEGELTVNFIVKPAVAISNIKADELKTAIKILVANVKATKASGLYTEIAVTEANVLDASEGTVCVKADLSQTLESLEKDDALVAAVNVKNGVSDFSTDFVKVTALFAAQFLPNIFSLGENAKVYFSTGNLMVDGGVNSILREQTEAGTLLPSIDETYVIKDETWKVPAASEWAYLLAHNKNILVETGNGAFGLAVMPDGYAGEVEGKTWAELEAAGAVLLPAAGYAYGDSAVSGLNEGGSYWTRDGKALDFDCMAVYPESEAVPAGIKQSVRLVKVVEQ